MQIMRDIPLTYFYNWSPNPDKNTTAAMAEFAANGAENIMICDDWACRLLTDPALWSKIYYNAMQCGVKLFEIHAPFGECYDFNTRLEYRRQAMIDEHIRLMQFAADVGCKTYVIHIGAWDCVCDHSVTLESMRSRSLAAVEKLVAAAEKYKIVLAVENSFEMSNSPDEVLYILNRFNSPYIGCCFDVGHANFMAPSPDGKPKNYTEHMLKRSWRGNLVQEPDALDKLLPHIVTTHLHDNNGVSDSHSLPGNGTVNWQEVMKKLNSAPRLLTHQSEVSPFTQNQPLSIRKLCETMSELVKIC